MSNFNKIDSRESQQLLISCEVGNTRIKFFAMGIKYIFTKIMIIFQPLLRRRGGYTVLLLCACLSITNFCHVFSQELIIADA